MPKFIPGLKLSELFYKEAVKPILDKHFPILAYTAGLFGYGSDVIGFDTPMSTDHMWGPRLVLLLTEEDYPQMQTRISNILSEELPYTFKGYAVNFSQPNLSDPGIRWMEPTTSGPINPLVFMSTILRSFEEYLNCNPYEPFDAATWLTFSEHRLLALTAGGVFHDDLGLEPLRQKLSYYPDDVWRFMLHSQWGKISQEEAFVGRTGDVGDEVGSQIIAARIVHSLMRLCFLMEKQYAPYSKWFGSAFAKLSIAPKLQPALQETLQATTWKARQAGLSDAYQIVAEAHNALKITEPLSTDLTDYFGRPYQVLFAGRFAEAIRKTITDAQIKQFPPVGSVSQFSDVYEIYDEPANSERMKALYA